jgi:putative FmdB family regulatory protein
MPLYEYQCDACSHRFEVIQKFSDSPIETCPKCGGEVKKLLSSPAVHFKGAGWYVTDYAKAGKTESGSATASRAEKAEKGESAGSSSESKTETKSASSSDSKSESKSESSPAPAPSKASE